MEAASETQSGTYAPPTNDSKSGKSRYTTISIPQPLYAEVRKAIEGTHFRSATEFLVYVTRLSLQSELVKDEVRRQGPPFYGPR